MLPRNLRNEIFAFSPISQIQLWTGNDNLLMPGNKLFSAHNCREILQLRYGLVGDQLRLYYDRIIPILGPMLSLTKVSCYYGEGSFYAANFVPAEIAIFLAVRSNDVMALRYLLDEYEPISHLVKEILFREAVLLSADGYEILAMILSRTMPFYLSAITNIPLPLKVRTLLAAAISSMPKELNSGVEELTEFMSTLNYVKSYTDYEIGDMKIDNQTTTMYLQGYWFAAKFNNGNLEQLAQMIINGANSNALVGINVSGEETEDGFIPTMLAYFQLPFIKQLRAFDMKLPFIWPAVLTTEMVADAPAILTLLKSEEHIIDSDDKRVYLIILRMLTGIAPTANELDNDVDGIAKEFALTLGFKEGENYLGASISDVVYSAAAFKNDTGGHELGLLNCWRLGQQVDFVEKSRLPHRLLSLTETKEISYGLEGYVVKRQPALRITNLRLYHQLTGDYTLNIITANSPHDLRLWQKYLPEKVNEKYEDDRTRDGKNELGIWVPPLKSMELLEAEKRLRDERYMELMNAIMEK